MTRVLRSAVKKNQVKEDLTSKLSISKNSKVIKRNSKKKVLAKTEENEQSNIWNNNNIISNIFKYTENKDLIEFNTACKRWNNVINPIIHRTIKLQRRRAFQNKDHDKRLTKSAKTDAEVEMCIFNNSKHAEYIKEFDFYENIEPQRAIQLFETFRFITKLSIGGSMSQDQFISMITPLTQLQELNLNCLEIKRIIKNMFVSNPAVLPPSLTKLTIESIQLYKNPELFIQTINSHTNLIEYKSCSYNGANFLDPFFKNYPTLKIFEYSYETIDHSQSLIKIFESNPQIKNLSVSNPCCNEDLMGIISRHLINLEGFNFKEVYSYTEVQTSTISKFTHPTKIKKLNLIWNKLSQCSLNSILLNCPYLEELSLDYALNYQTDASDIVVDPSKLANIKKLKLRYGILNKNPYNSLLMKCSRINELDIELPRDWKECMKVIGSTFTNLESLIIRPAYNIYGQERNTFYQEFYESKFLASNSLYKSTLTSLTLFYFNFYDSKAEYFNEFQKLKYIDYRCQHNADGSMSSQEISFNKDLWPGYKFEKIVNKYKWDARLSKLSS